MVVAAHVLRLSGSADTDSLNVVAPSVTFLCFLLVLLCIGTTTDYRQTHGTTKEETLEHINPDLITICSK